MRNSGALIAYLSFVIYGSLVPLDYQAVPFDEAWRRFQHIPFLHLGVESRADWIANGVLYAPLGYLATRAFESGFGRVTVLGSILALPLCASVAVGVEFAQLFFPPRTVSQNDLIAEFIGSALGIVLASMLRGWGERIVQALADGGVRTTHRGLEIYSAMYVALSFFPYDLLLTWRELQDKSSSSTWGWLLAHNERGMALSLLLLAVECAMTLPIGMWLAGRRGVGSVPIGRAAALGLALGLAIEIGQFFVASGVSQGVSVATRVVGVAVGVWLWPRVRRAGADGVRRAIRRTALPAAPVYLLLLLAISGWFKSSWLGWDRAAATWATVKLLPFYYHYYTSEAVALYSLGSVALMYLPIAAAGWAWRLPTAATLVVAAGLAGVVETGKLLIPGLHPDPTNLLIAVTAVWLALQAAALGERRATTAPTPLPAADARPVAPARAFGPPAIALVIVPLTLWLAWRLPAFAALTLAVLSVSAAVVWRWPVAALAIVPAGLPVLDFAPWTGRFFLDEFDLLVAVCLAAAWARTPGLPQGDSKIMGRMSGAALLGLSLAVSTAVALVPLPVPDANGLANYTSAYNALRIVKGALWAWAFVAVFRRVTGVEDRAGRFFTTGMLVGLTYTVGWIVWERASFVGLFDFTSTYRVSGPFSAMHRGGAYVECYLAVTSAFAVTWTARARSWLVRGAGLALLVLTTYAVMVTFSRNGYAAYALAVLGALATGMAPAPRGTRRWAIVTMVVGVVTAVAWPVLVGGFAGERLARTRADLDVRAAHWGDALDMRDDGWVSTLFGQGLARFPELHFWRSREPVRAASYRLVTAAGNTFLRLGPGATLYVEQIVTTPGDASLVAEMDVRSGGAEAMLGLALCRKWLLTSKDCVGSQVRVPAAGPDRAWHRVRVPLAFETPGDRAGFADPPLVFSILTPSGGSTVDVDQVGLRTRGSVQLIANGGFEQGMDRWFFTTDVDPPWHIHSLPVAILFDQGWLGVLAWSAVLLSALIVGSRATRRGDPVTSAAWVALLAFLVCASVNTLIDSPRFLWLLLVMAGLAGTCPPAEREAPAQPGRAPRTRGQRHRSPAPAATDT